MLSSVILNSFEKSGKFSAGIDLAFTVPADAVKDHSNVAGRVDAVMFRFLV
jgi:hypothetical protein